MKLKKIYGLYVPLLLSLSSAAFAAKESVVKDIFDYPEVGSTYSSEAKLCDDNESPGRYQNPEGIFSCNKSYRSNFESSNKNLDSVDRSTAGRTVRYNSDQELQAVVIGLYNVIVDVDEAEKLLMDKYGHLGVKLEHQETPSGPYRFKMDVHDNAPVTDVKRKRFSFGCNVKPYNISSGFSFDDVHSSENGRMQGISKELKGSYTWVNDSRLGGVFSFFVDKNNVNKIEGKRCVVANIAWGERKRNTFDSPERPFMEITVAEVNSDFIFLSENW